MDSIWFSFILALLATWRVTHLLSREDGPGDVLLKLRLRAGPGVIGRLMDCFNCLSLWVAAPFAFLVGRNGLEILLVWLGLSGGACLLERTERGPMTIREWPDTEGDDDGLLWRQAGNAAESRDDRADADSAETFATSAGRSTATVDYGYAREKNPGTDS
jgi:hypothetical protein